MQHFDKIICINLRERTDKYNSVKTVFDKLNLDVEFYHAEKHKTSGRIGCFESHISVIQNCYDKNLQNVLIFEDDVIDTPAYSSNVISNIELYMKNNEWCEYLQLGYTILLHEFYSYFTSVNLDSNYTRANIIKYNGNCTHAYIVNRKGMERILKTWKQSVYEKELDLDVYYKELFSENGAACCPILFDQNFCIDSDNDTATTSYYKLMRDVSCVQYNFSFLYFLSLCREYIRICIIIILCAVVFFSGFVSYFLYKNKKYKNWILKKTSYLT